jgi:hypothetical protein
MISVPRPRRFSTRYDGDVLFSPKGRGTVVPLVLELFDFFRYPAKCLRLQQLARISAAFFVPLQKRLFSYPFSNVPPDLPSFLRSPHKPGCYETGVAIHQQERCSSFRASLLVLFAVEEFWTSVA